MTLIRFVLAQRVSGYFWSITTEQRDGVLQANWWRNRQKEKAELQKQSRLNGLAKVFAVLLNVWSTGILRVHRADRIFYALSYEHHESGGLHV